MLFAACAVPLAAGVAIELVDAALAAVGPLAPASPALLLFTASAGALFFLLALLPFTPLAIAFASRPAHVVAGSVAAAALVVPAFMFGRFAYKSLPWSAGDLAFIAAGGAALAIVAWLITRFLARAIAPRAASVSRWLARASIPLLLLTLPVLFRIVPAALSESASQRAARAATLPAARSEQRLLLLSIDTMRYDRFGSTGDPAARTPHLDRLARASTQFAECVSPSPWTLPSLASLLTGTYPGEHLMLQELTGISDSVPNLAETLRKEGWRTGAFVSNPWLATGALARGFDAFDVAERIECLSEIRPTFLGRMIAKAFLRGRRLDSGEAITGRGLRWIGEAESAGESWFVWLHYFDPHLPNWPASPLDRLGGPPPSHVGASITVEEIRAGAFDGGAEGRAEIERLYAGEVAVTDLAIGRVARALEGAGVLNAATIVVTGDHGEEFWEHGDYGHGHTMFDEVVRVPLFIRAPSTGAPLGEARPPGRVDARLARLIDLAPTALAAAGIAAPTVPRGFTGRDLLASRPSSGEDGASPDTAYGEATLYGPERKYLRAGGRTLVFTPEGAPPDSAVLFFDLALDPEQNHNLAPADPAAADSLLARLLLWKARVGSERTTSADALPTELDPSVVEALRALGYIR